MQRGGWIQRRKRYREIQRVGKVLPYSIQNVMRALSKGTFLYPDPEGQRLYQKWKNYKIHICVRAWKDSILDQSLVRLLWTLFSTRSWFGGFFFLSALPNFSKHPMKSVSLDSWNLDIWSPLWLLIHPSPSPYLIPDRSGLPPAESDSVVFARIPLICDAYSY